MIFRKIKTFGNLLLFTSTLMFFASCSKDEEKPSTMAISANLSGAQEVPAVTTSGSATLRGNYNKDNNALTYTISWTGLSGNATLMHFHGPANPGVNANVAVPVTGFTPGASGSYSGTATLTDAQETDLLAGKYYFNIHTAAHTGGEIRGQVTAQ